MAVDYEYTDGSNPLQPLDGRLFKTLVRGLEVNAVGFQQELSRTTPPDLSYVILFSARSGSTWLTSVLSATGQLGQPEEYINPDFVRDVASFLSTTEEAACLDIAKRRRKTENGVFGIDGWSAGTSPSKT
jgi:trehalose 2-sulfotransferase